MRTRTIAWILGIAAALTGGTALAHGGGHHGPAFSHGYQPARHHYNYRHDARRIYNHHKRYRHVRSHGPYYYPGKHRHSHSGYGYGSYGHSHKRHGHRHGVVLSIGYGYGSDYAWCPSHDAYYRSGDVYYY